MDKQFRRAFDAIHAEEQLKKDTAQYLQGRIEKGGRRSSRSGFRMAAACACLALLVTGAVSGNLYFTPVTYVDIDVNPSVELVVNRYGRVLEAKAYNEEGEALLADLSLRYKGYSRAVEMLMGAMIDADYLHAQGLVSVTVQAQEDARQAGVLSAVENTVLGTLEMHHVSAELDIFSVTPELKQEAGACHLSPAKYLAAQELQGLDPTVTMEDCSQHSIGEIRAQIRAHGGDHSGGGNGNHAGETGEAAPGMHSAQGQSKGTHHQGGHG